MGGSAARKQAVPMGRGDAGKGGMDPTVRQFLPWHEVEKRMAVRANGGKLPEGYDGHANDEDEVSGEHETRESKAPDSGIRVSESISLKASGEVSFKVYTVADLDRRMAIEGDPLSSRGSLASLSLSRSGSRGVPAPNHWKNAGLAAYRILDTLAGWLVQRGEKLPVGDVLRHPVGVFKVDAKAALKTVDWKRVGVFMGVGFLVLSALLAVVLVVADLTDEMKPAKALDTKNASAMNAPETAMGPGASLVKGATAERFTVNTITPSNPIAPVAPSPMVAAPVQPKAYVPPPAPAKADIELDDKPAPAAAKPAKPAAKPAKPAAKKPAKKTEDFTP